MTTSQHVRSPSNAYNVVNSGCLSQHSLAHEIGHNQGNKHDRASTTGTGAYPYSYGLPSVRERWHRLPHGDGVCLHRCQSRRLVLEPERVLQRLSRLASPTKVTRRILPTTHAR